MPTGVYTRTKETLAKMSLARKGVPLSEEWRKNMSIAQRKRDYSTFKWSHLSKYRGTKWCLGRKLTEEHKRKIGDKTIERYNLIGRKTYRRYIHVPSKELEEWRSLVFKRDNYTCRECGAKNGMGKDIILNAHHIKAWALFPDLRYIVDNGMTLCITCHEKTDNYRKLQKC